MWKYFRTLPNVREAVAILAHRTKIGSCGRFTMFKSLLVVGLMVAIATNSGYAFVVDRSAAAAWDTAPSLDTEQRTSVDQMLNGKMQVTGMNKILQASDAKKSAKHVDESTAEDPSREKRSEVVIISSDSASRGTESLKEPKDALNGLFEENAGKDADFPRNVVFLLIDETSQDKEELWNTFRSKHDFPVQGLLQSCRNNNTPLKYNLQDDPMALLRKDKDCECEHFLRANVGALLSWARHAKVMTTGAVSATNFSIPAAIGYDGPAGIAKEMNEADENNVKREARHSRPEFHDVWRLIDLDRQPGALPTSASSKPEGAANTDGMWDVFDMFSRIRVAFFRSLLDSLGGNLGAQEDEFPPRRPSPLQSNLVDLVSDTIKELKSASNEKGYMLVAAAPGNDLSSTVELLTRETSPKDTLLVVAGICSADKKPVPFYASGPGAKSLLEARSVWDLPGAIKSAVTGGCRGAGCRVRRHDQTLPALPRVPALMPTAEEGDAPSLRRVGRQDEAAAGATDISADAVTMMLSLATSIVATLAVKF
ncbi:uncharacterized protein LOC124301049 isoform X1 [Neodiprion virginianus]|uniref:uncharacterized protein LOC124301049 isoform X1 n=3 Tax=Neodiprion virginianus TaxID=2961670 RepID=UPI001EE76FC7|nr:uncharacterized protein LOC124301049 isoform X1 [Neodiprion virginianus]